MCGMDGGAVITLIVLVVLQSGFLLSKEQCNVFWSSGANARRRMQHLLAFQL